MRRANGAGGVVYLGANRRKPYGAKVTESICPVEKDGKTIYKPKYKYIGYFKTKKEAEAYLDSYINATQEEKEEMLSASIKTIPDVCGDLVLTAADRMRLNSVLNGMKERCYNPESENYKNYGAKGVKVCKEWLDDPLSFHLWAMLYGYMEGLSIDRIDPRGNYEPSNCRWTDTFVQNANKRAKHDDCYSCMFRNAYINRLHETCRERVLLSKEKGKTSEEESESC